MDSPYTVSPQLLETLQARQEARFFQEALSFYIPPQVGRYVSDETPKDAAECISQWLSDNQSSCLLLLGDSGAGKTLFGQWLTRHCAQHPAFARRVPLFIPLLAVKHPHGNLLDDYLKHHLGIEDRNQRDAIQAQPLLLILDGFDEMRERKNLFLSNELWRLNDVKVIISCRSQALAHEHNVNAFFYPYDKLEQVQPLQLKEYVMMSFTEKQIDAYVEQYVTTHQDDIQIQCLADLSANPHTSNWLDWKTYQTAVAQLPGLASLLKSPFILSVVVKILPTLFAKYQGKEKIEQHRLVGIDLYDEFVKQWFTRQKVKLLKSGHLQKDNCTIEEVFEKYSKGIANVMLQTHKTSIELTPQYLGSLLEQQGIFSENAVSTIVKPLTCSTHSSLAVISQKALTRKKQAKEVTLVNEGKEKIYLDQDISVGDEKIKLSTILSGCPVMKVRDKRYAFLHQSLLEYFAAKQLLEGVAAETSIAIGYELNERLLMDEPDVLHFLAERVQQDESLKRRLFEVIEESKFDERVEIASANAITILNKAGVSFSQKCFSYIRIKGADLSNAILDSTNLQHSDLRGVSLRGAWLNGAKLGGALMKSVVFGESPYIKTDGRIFCIAFSKDGTYIAAGSFCNIILYQKNGSDYQKNGELKSHVGRVDCVAFSPDGKQLASGSQDQNIRLWSVEDQRFLGKLEGHTGGVTSVAFSPDGKCLASGGQDNSLRLWSVEEKQLLSKLKGHTSYVRSIAFSPDGKRLVSAGGVDKVLRLWSVEDQQPLGELKGHTGWIYCVAFSPDGNWLVSGSDDMTLRLWSVQEQRSLSELKGHTSTVTSVAFSPDGKQLASGSQDNSLRLWSVVDPRPLSIWKGHTGIVAGVAFSPDGKQLASGSMDQTIRLWNIEDQQFLNKRKEHSRIIKCAAFSPDGKWFVSNRNGQALHLWNMETQRFLGEWKEHFDRTECLAFSPDGKQLASGGQDKTLRLWDIENRQLLCELKGHTATVASVVFSPNGKWLASGSADQTLRLWDIEDQRLLSEWKGHAGPVNSVAFSPDGKRLASGSHDNIIRLWNVEDQQLLSELKGQTGIGIGIVASVAFSPDGKQLASACSSWDNSTLCLWSVEDQKSLGELKGHMDIVNCVAFSPDGKWLASGSQDKTLRLWDPHTGQRIGVYSFTYDVQTLSFTRYRGKTVLSAEIGKDIYCFEMKMLNSKVLLILLWSTGSRELRSNALDLCEAIDLDEQNERLLKQHKAIGNLSQRKTEKVLGERNLPIPYNPKQPPYNLFSQQHLITLNSAMVNIVHKTKKGKETEDGNDSKHVFLVIEHIENGFYILTRADLYLDRNQKNSQGLIVTGGRVLVEISVKSLRDMQLLVEPDANVFPEDIEKYQHCAYSWAISTNQACDLIRNLEADRSRCLSYHYLRNKQEKEKYHCLDWCEKNLEKIGIDVSQQKSQLGVIVAHPTHHLPDDQEEKTQTDWLFWTKVGAVTMSVAAVGVLGMNLYSCSQDESESRCLIM